MGRFLDEPQKTYKGKFLDEPITPEVVPAKKSPAYGGVEGLRKFGFGGPIAYGTVPGSEDILPAAGQTIGEIGGYPGSVAGASVGIAGRDVIRGIRKGDYKPAVQFGVNPGFGFSEPERVKEIMTTAAVDGFFRGAPRVLFPKQFGGKKRIEVGKKLGEIADNVTKKAPFAHTAKKPLIDEIDQTFKENPFERGPAVQALANAKKKLMELKGPLTFDKARQLEQQLGREAQFATDSTQGHFVKAPKAPRLNSSIKALRNKVSGKVDEMASNAGFPEFESTSRKFGELSNKFPEKDLQKMYSPTGMLIRGAIGGAGVAAPALFGAGPLGAVAAPALLWANVPPKVKTAIFRKAIDTPIGRGFGKGASVLASEGMRKVVRS